MMDNCANDLAAAKFKSEFNEFPFSDMITFNDNESTFSNIHPLVMNEKAEFERKKRENMMEVLTYTNTTGLLILFGVMSAHFYYGSNAPLYRLMCPLAFQIAVAFVRETIPRGYKFSERYGSFIIGLIMMIALTEGSLTLSP